MDVTSRVSQATDDMMEPLHTRPRRHSGQLSQTHGFALPLGFAVISLESYSVLVPGYLHLAFLFAAFRFFLYPLELSPPSVLSSLNASGFLSKKHTVPPTGSTPFPTERNGDKWFLHLNSELQVHLHPLAFVLLPITAEGLLFSTFPFYRQLIVKGSVYMPPSSGVWLVLTHQSFSLRPACIDSRFHQFRPQLLHIHFT